MGFKRFFPASMIATSAMFYSAFVAGDLSGLLPPPQPSLDDFSPRQSSQDDVRIDEAIVLNPINDYLRAARQLILPLHETIDLSQNAPAFAYSIQPPPNGSGLWSIRFTLAHRDASAAVVLKLVTVAYDEHQRVVGFEELLVQNGIGEAVIDEVLWPAKPVYVIGSTSLHTQAKLSISPVVHNWSVLTPNGVYTGAAALMTPEPVIEKFEFVWKAPAVTGEQPLWDVKLVSEPNTRYSLQINSGRLSASAEGADQQNLTFRNILAPETEMRFIVRPSGQEFSPVALMVNQQPAMVADREHELSAPQTLAFGRPGNGVISHQDTSSSKKSETDTWIINVPAGAQGDAEKPIQIQVTAANASNTVTANLKKAGRGSALLSKSAMGELNSGALQLQAGEYRLNVSAKQVGTQYKVTAEWAQQQSANSEKEPNNSPQDANAIIPRKVMKGELSNSTDEDFFLLDTSGEGAAQYWRLIATGGGVKRMTLGKNYWIETHQDENNPVLSMNYMLLLPGVHEIKLTGEGRYSFRAIPLGPPKPGFEIEPNDGKLGPSQRLILGETARGSLDKAKVSGGSDIDRYRFSVNKRGKYRISLVSPDDEGLQARLYLNDGPWFSPKENTTAGSTLRYAALLLAGEYIIELTNQDGRRALDEYSLRVEALPGATDVMQEPNDIVGFSTPLTGSGTTTANLDVFDQTDCYSMAPTAQQSSVEIITPPKFRVKFLDRFSSSQVKLVTRDIQNKALWTIKPHAQTLFVCISRDWLLSDSTPYTLTIDMGASTPEPKAQLATTQLPQALTGGLNVAWHGLGARWEPTEEGIPARTQQSTIRKLNKAINNISPLGIGVEWDAFRNNADTYRLKLAGDAVIPLAGVVLNTRTGLHVRNKTRHFRVLVSEDGVDFSEAMLGELLFTNDDQYLVFDQPVNAKYIKFLPLDSFQSRSPHYARFQELKVIASSTYAAEQEGIDLASVAAGGHVVRHDFKPATRNNADALDAAILDAQQTDENSKPRLCQFPDKQNTAKWVVGFHHNRAARVTLLDYDSAAGSGGAPVFESVTVSLSAVSPLGPWTEIARWNAEQLQSSLSIPMPDAPWVRFIQFVATGKEKTAYQCPHNIAVRETATNSDYRSILGEWSEYGPKGPFEAAYPPVADKYPPKGGASADTATVIASNKTLKSSVKRERNDDWFLYRSDGSNAKANSLFIRVAHPNSFKPLVHILDGNGKVLQTMVEQEEQSATPGENSFDNLPLGWTTTDYTAWRTDSANYTLHIEEPPRNVVLTWDSSGSMGPQLPYIEMASRRWADYLKPDHEYAKIMKFQQKSHPENEWANLPHMLQAALHAVSLKPGGSSDAENSLLDANELLSPRYGNHAIVVSTDGEFPRSKKFWDSQEEHCSTLYAAGLGAAAVGEDFELQSVYQDNFQNWVSACGGHYRYCDSVTCLEDFYEFAAYDIRKPKPYQLKVSEIYKAPPKPGLLSVIAGAKTLEATGKALYVILDASGSMLQQLEGKRRIDIAKATLKKVTRDSVGKYNQFGMRTFGLKVDACDHARTLPIAKHTASVIDAAISKVTAVNNAKTPIAASLSAAAADLEAYPGEKVIVLLTDGEETCDGDSESILNSLRSRDINVKMHIVGFALDDAALIEQFKHWATLGGGEYYAAGNQSALQTALHNAVTPRFEVRNGVGDIVLSGHLGDEQRALPPGEYVVALPDYPAVDVVRVALAAGGEEIAEFR